MSFAYLDDATLEAVRNAAVDLGFADDDMLRTLTADISPRFVATAMTGGNALARLLNLTRALNTTRVLLSGEVPLAKWLTTASMLAAGRTEEMVFRRALEQISTDGVASPGNVSPQEATADVRDVPHTDGALEITIEQDDTIEVGFLHAGSQASRSVVKLMVHRHFGGVPAFLPGNVPDVALGTGWLIAPRMLVNANDHVINARLPLEPRASDQDVALQGAATTALFDYYLTSSPTVRATTTECLIRDEKLDYALLRLPADAPDRPPLRLRTNPIVKPKERALQERVNVLQHPNGNPMRLGFRNNFVVTGDEERLSYLTDTAGGSSGSPICDDAWFVAGLHRGFSTIGDEPVLVWGLEIRQENYGTPIPAVLRHLESTRPDLLAEIRAGQLALP